MARYRQTHNNCRKATTSEIIWEVYIKVTIRNKIFSLSSFTKKKNNHIINYKYWMLFLSNNFTKFYHMYLEIQAIYSQLYVCGL